MRHLAPAYREHGLSYMQQAAIWEQDIKMPATLIGVALKARIITVLANEKVKFVSSDGWRALHNLHD